MNTKTRYYDVRHGGPYDRGSADSYYRRQYEPHYFTGGTMATPKVTHLTSIELAAYKAGYDENEMEKNFKEY